MWFNQHGGKVHRNARWSAATKRAALDPAALWSTPRYHSDQTRPNGIGAVAAAAPAHHHSPLFAERVRWASILWINKSLFPHYCSPSLISDRKHLYFNAFLEGRRSSCLIMRPLDGNCWSVCVVGTALAVWMWCGLVTTCWVFSPVSNRSNISNHE